jgi:hypothetical protein
MIRHTAAMLTFDRIFAEHAATGLARQLALCELIGERGWELDLTSGTVTFGDDLRYGVQLLGTESHDDGSWLWAWANEASNLPPALLHLCGWLREYGTGIRLQSLPSPRSRLNAPTVTGWLCWPPA